MIHADKFRYECACCGREYDPSPDLYLCPACQHHDQTQPPCGVLKTVYDYGELRDADICQLFATGFIDLLPLLHRESLPPLHTGNTPLLRLRPPHDIGRQDFTLRLKDDARNPTFSLKDRASAVVSAYARECGIERIVVASTGNAGSSLAGICAAQGQEAVVFVPARAPLAKRTQIQLYGARLIPVEGTYDDAFALSLAATEKFGWYNRNTAYNPLTIEGKKTVALEIAAQLHSHVPDYVFVPVGDGVILAGVYKGFEDLLRIGLLERMPIIVAVQAEGSANIINNLYAENLALPPAYTLADSIAVDVPANFHMARTFLLQYHGESVGVSDANIIDAELYLGRAYGIFAEPASAAAFAGLLRYLDEDRIPAGAEVVVLNTGCGLKDPATVQSCLPEIPTISTRIDALDEWLRTNI